MTPTTQELEPLVQEATSLLKALAHPARMMICCQLKDNEMSVSKIEETLGIKQPRLSRELAKLREEGLVETRRDSKVIFYRLSDDRASALIDALCAIMLGRADVPIKATAQKTLRANKRGGYGMFARTDL